MDVVFLAGIAAMALAIVGLVIGCAQLGANPGAQSGASGGKS